MQFISRSNRNTVYRVHCESAVESFDCGEEFSLDHWIRVCELLNESESAVLPADTTCSAGNDDAFAGAGFRSGARHYRSTPRR